MKLDQKQIRLLVNLQGSLEQKEVKFLVFHEDQKYTVTNKLEEAMDINSTIFVITSKNVVALGPVLAETKEEIKEQVEMILSVVQSSQVLEDHQLESIGVSKLPLIEHPTYTADVFTVIAHELEFDSNEMNTMLSILERMRPIYAEYFLKNRNEDLMELTFVAKQILLKMNKSAEVVDMFINLLKEKLHVVPINIEEQATRILTTLLFEKMGHKLL